jgi:hypothetical protein
MKYYILNMHFIPVVYNFNICWNLSTVKCAMETNDFHFVVWTRLQQCHTRHSGNVLHVACQGLLVIIARFILHKFLSLTDQSVVRRSNTVDVILVGQNFVQINVSVLIQLLHCVTV